MYCFAADPCQADLIQVYELWEDAPSLAAHFLHENYFNMRTMFGQHGITGAVTHKYRIDAVAIRQLHDDGLATESDGAKECQQKTGHYILDSRSRIFNEGWRHF